MRREIMVEQLSMESLLLVEDKAELRAMLRKALERAGHKVDEAPDGSAAVAKVRARRYLLVLTRNQAGRPHYPRHSHHGVRLGGRGRHGNEGRRL
jgi:hypothetical protein